MRRMLCCRMFRTLVAVVMSGVCLIVRAQENQQSVEQALEQESASSEGEGWEEDGQWQQWDYLARNRLNLNKADEEALVHLLGITPIQADQLMHYRARFGTLIDVLELQAVPGWDHETIRRILPFVQVFAESRALPLFRERIRKGEHLFLLRSGQTWEGFKVGKTGGEPDNHAGSRSSLLLRYTYRFRDLLQWGITVEKDAGEKFFTNGVRSGPDFWTLHFSIRAVGNIRAFVLGDFHVNLGQGLVHWQSMAFRKGASGLLVHRQGHRLRSYNGTDENRFHRGMGMDIGKKHTGLMIFAALDRMDGHRKADSAAGEGYTISALQGSGLHRTDSEIAGKDAFRQQVLGGSLYWNNGRWKLALNSVGYRFPHPLEKSDEPYRRYDISGREWFNLSIDYGGSVRNMYLFGEAAYSKNGAPGFLQGLMVSIDPRMDMAFVLRHFPAGYKALQANAFTEQAAPGNETGLYAALNLKPLPAWLISGWIDITRFPWLRYRVNRPSSSMEVQLSLLWKPNKQLEILQRVQSVKKAINPPSGTLSLLEPMERQQFQYRFQVSYQPNRFIILHQRVDVHRVGFMEDKEQGVLLSVDLTLQPPKRRTSFSTRLSWFQADSYDARLYQYERDVLYYYAISPFYRRGLRTYLLAESRWGKQWTAWIKFSTTFYNDNQLFINNNIPELPCRKTVIHIQLRHIF